MADVGAPEQRSSPGERHAEPVASAGDSIPRLRPWGRLLLVLLHLVPKNALSRLAGRFASVRWPALLQRIEIRIFARLVGADLSEARDPIGTYESLQAFFTRALREGARPIQGDASSLVAPCDGAWGSSGAIHSGRLVQVKGRTYSVAELLGDPDRAHRYEGGTFATFYLSPRDYHRFHTPIAGRITRVDYQPGALWPVNAVGLQGVDRLFARNERICAFLRAEGAEEGRGVDGASGHAGEPEIALVAVGATMVGSVCLSFDALRTNVPGARPVRKDYGDAGPTFARGEEWGHFEFGSTIVMLVPPGGYEVDARPVGGPLTLGEVIGRRRG